MIAAVTMEKPARRALKDLTPDEDEDGLAVVVVVVEHGSSSAVPDL